MQVRWAAIGEGSMLIRSMAGAAEESGSMTMSTACSNSDSEAAQLVLTSIVLPFFSVSLLRDNRIK